MDSGMLIQEASGELSLLSRMVVDRADMREQEGKLVLTIDPDSARLLTMGRVRQEIEQAVKLTWGLEVSYERSS
jgi:hypothetical protein